MGCKLPNEILVFLGSGNDADGYNFLLKKAIFF